MNELCVRTSACTKWVQYIVPNELIYERNKILTSLEKRPESQPCVIILVGNDFTHSLQPTLPCENCDTRKFKSSGIPTEQRNYLMKYIASLRV